MSRGIFWWYKDLILIDKNNPVKAIAKHDADRAEQQMRQHIPNVLHNRSRIRYLRRDLTDFATYSRTHL